MNVEKWVEDDANVYIGREQGDVPASPWANPYKVEEHGREAALEMYKDRLRSTPSLLDSLEDLEGKSLGCWCRAYECHGQILVDFLVNRKYELTT